MKGEGAKVQRFKGNFSYGVYRIVYGVERQRLDAVLMMDEEIVHFPRAAGPAHPVPAAAGTYLGLSSLKVLPAHAASNEARIAEE